MADTKIIVNCETGEVSEVELTAAEVKQREADAAAFATRKAAEEAAATALATLKASAKAKLVAGEPLTEAEAGTLIL